MNFARVINLSLSTFADNSISIEWTPTDTRLRGKRKPGNARNPQTKKKKLETSYQQRSRSRDQERRRTNSGRGSGHTKPAPPTLPSQTPGWPQPPPVGRSRKSAAKPSYSSFIALRLAVDHSFKTEYTRRFKEDFVPLDVICDCGEEERTLTYIMFDCPLFSRARNDAQNDNRRTRHSIYDLFSSIDEAINSSTS